MDSGIIEIFLFAEWLIGVVILICFFVLCSNVSKIKKYLRNSRYQHMKAEYYKYYVLGDKQKAYEAVLYIIFEELSDPELMKEERNRKYSELERQYEAIILNLGFTFPENPFILK